MTKTEKKKRIAELKRDLEKAEKRCRNIVLRRNIICAPISYIEEIVRIKNRINDLERE